MSTIQYYIGDRCELAIGQKEPGGKASTPEFNLVMYAGRSILRLRGLVIDYEGTSPVLDLVRDEREQLREELDGLRKVIEAGKGKCIISEQEIGWLISDLSSEGGLRMMEYIDHLRARNAALAVELDNLITDLRNELEYGHGHRDGFNEGYAKAQRDADTKWIKDAKVSPYFPDSVGGVE